MCEHIWLNKVLYFRVLSIPRLKEACTLHIYTFCVANSTCVGKVPFSLGVLSAPLYTNSFCLNLHICKTRRVTDMSWFRHEQLWHYFVSCVWKDVTVARQHLASLKSMQTQSVQHHHMPLYTCPSRGSTLCNTMFRNPQIQLWNTISSSYVSYVL